MQLSVKILIGISVSRMDGKIWKMKKEDQHTWFQCTSELVEEVQKRIRSLESLRMLEYDPGVSKEMVNQILLQDLFFFFRGGILALSDDRKHAQEKQQYG